MQDVRAAFNHALHVRTWTNKNLIFRASLVWLTTPFALRGRVWYNVGIAFVLNCRNIAAQSDCSSPTCLIVRHTSKDGSGNWQRKLIKYVFTSDYRSLLFDPSQVSSLHQRQRRSLEVAMLQWRNEIAWRRLNNRIPLEQVQCVRCTGPFLSMRRVWLARLELVMVSKIRKNKCLAK